MALRWLRISFVYLIIVGLSGCLLRLLFTVPLPGLNYRYILHAHSHLALLGWVFNVLFTGILLAYIPDLMARYRRLFWLLQLSVTGMLFSFPVTGYAAVSITFSTLHIFLSWWFAVKFYRHTAARPWLFSLSLIRWGLAFMVLSALGPFALGAFMAQGLSQSLLYNLSIYFYLHFQYNGWISFAIFGLFFHLLEKHNVQVSARQKKMFLVLMVVSCSLGFALSVLWTRPAAWVYVLGFGAACCQLAAFGYFLAILAGHKTRLPELFKGPARFLFLFALGSFAVKILMQFATAFPVMADLAYKVRNLTIGYLHIVFLGFATVFLIGWLLQTNILQIKRPWATAGLWLFLTGFVASELIIFFQPLFILAGWLFLTHGNACLFVVSLLMPAGCMVLYYYTNLNGSLFKKRGTCQ